MGSLSVPRLATVINNSSTIQKILKGVNKNPAVYNAVAAFGLAAILRPALIGCFNFKNDKDKKYSQASAIAAGLIELGATIALFIPLNKGIAKASDRLFQAKGTFYEGNNIALRQFKTATNRMAKLMALVPISLARFALIKPVVNYLFGKPDKKENLLENYARNTKEGKFIKWA